MKKDNIIVFCLIIIILLGVSNLIVEMTNTKQNKKLEITSALLTEKQLVKYLGITEKELQVLLPTETDDGYNEGDFPLIKINDTYYFPKVAVDKWLADILHNTYTDQYE